MVEFTGAGDSPLTQFISCLVEQQWMLADATDGKAGEYARTMLEDDLHSRLFQAAYHCGSVIDGGVRPKLTAAIDAHNAFLKASLAYSNGDISQLEFNRQFGIAGGLAAELLKFATPVAAPVPERDGPVSGFRWRHSGKVTPSTMQPAAWRMAENLFKRPGRTATFDDLIKPVYEDSEHIADANAFGSLRRAANEFFRGNEIPLRMTINSRMVSLLDD